MDSKSQMNLFHEFAQEELFRSQITFNNNLSAILDYCEYSIRIQFNASEKPKIKSKNRKQDISKQFVSAFASQSREEKIQYYMRVMGYIKNFLKDNYLPPKSPFTGVLNDIGYSRSFNVRRWKEKKLRLDQDRHLMFAERESKIKSYDMKDYLLRKSKNKDYFSFVLQAINNNPPEKSRTVHIGFTNKNAYQLWFKSIKFSVQYREWELYSFLFKNKFYGNGKISNRLVTDDIRLGNNKQLHSEEFNNLNYSMVQGKQAELDEDFLSKSMVVFSNHRTEFDEPYKFDIGKRPMEKSGAQSLISSLMERQQAKKQAPNKKTEQTKERQTAQLQKKQQLEKQIKIYEQKKQQAHLTKTYVDQLIEGDNFEEPDVFEDKMQEEKEESKQEKKHLDLFHKLYPEYELSELELYLNFQSIYQEQNFKIYQNMVLEKRLKMVISFDKIAYSFQQIISMISKVETSKELIENIQEIQVKTFIPSQNSALIYQVLKPFNRLYRSRDFVFIRHVFSEGKKLYMIDKSIQNTNYPPFMTIVRGQLCIIYGLFERQNCYQLIADVEMTNEGYINPVQQTNLTLKYLKSFSNLPKAKIEENTYKFFDLEWDISKNKANKIEDQIRSRKKTIHQIDIKIKKTIQNDQNNRRINEQKNFSKKNPRNETELKKEVDSKINQEQVKVQKRINSNSRQADMNSFKSSILSPEKRADQLISPNKVEIKRFDKKTMEEYGQINAEELNKINNFKADLSIVRNVDEGGYIIIGNSFIKHRYILQPLSESPRIFMSSSQGHPIWKDQWMHDDKEGGIIFIHKKKIQDQKGVLKFILSKMAKNLVSGQSILNISLPVDIFGPESNLQRFLFSMIYGPIVLEGLEKQNAIVKLIKSIVFGLSNSLLYLSMQKPFNPILGQTFQCWINGCPAYAEQISHHPPIGALMLKGRGYQITAQLQSKVSLGVNSGTGTNDGVYKVKFADGTTICFITPGGEVSGLAHGDRKFNLVGKSHYWIQNTNIMIEIVCDPFKKGFFSVGKQQQPSDYFQGTIWEVKPEFMAKFLNGKRREPEQKQKVREYGKINGIWNRFIRYNNEEVFNFDTMYPLTLEYQPNPLPSDSNWRQDIEYRRRNEVTRAQNQKERLEVFQRKDRKLREKYNKKK